MKIVTHRTAFNRIYSALNVVYGSIESESGAMIIRLFDEK
jgi:hypothetical protein